MPALNIHVIGEKTKTNEQKGLKSMQPLEDAPNNWMRKMNNNTEDFEQGVTDPKLYPFYPEIH